MAKPIGPACNLDCRYCYYLDTARMYASRHRFRMTDALLERYVRGFIEASPGPEVHFVWHGGEPTLAGLDFYQRAVALQRRYLPQGWTCWNNLQTNGTNLDDDWCAFLAAERFEVGLSIDGPAALHDRQRPDRGGHGSHARVEGALRRLLDHGVEPDLLCTVTPETAAQPLAVYRYLRELGPTFVQFLPIVNRTADGVSADTVGPEAYGSFLCAVFDEWVRHDVGRIQVQLFLECALIWSGHRPSLCYLSETCGRVLVVEHDGAVYSCDHFVNPAHRLGSLGGARLGDLVESPVQRDFGRRKRDALPRHCMACPWLQACNGGCPKDRFSTAADGQPGLNYLCAGLRTFYAHVDPYLRRMVALAPRPTAIMAEVLASDHARWRGVGRNDPCPCGGGRKAKQCCWAERR